MWIILSGADGLYHCCIQFFHSEELNNEKPLIHSYLQVQWHKDSPKIVIIISWLTPTKDAWLFYIQVSCCCNVNWKKRNQKINTILLTIENHRYLPWRFSSIYYSRSLIFKFAQCTNPRYLIARRCNPLPSFRSFTHCVVPYPPQGTNAHHKEGINNIARNQNANSKAACNAFRQLQTSLSNSRRRKQSIIPLQINGYS